jgi:hypothetical protein
VQQRYSKGHLDAEKKCEEHAKGLAVEESVAKRKGDAAVVVKASCENKVLLALPSGIRKHLTPNRETRIPRAMDAKPRMGGRIQFFGLASPSLPMMVSNARQGASKVTTSRVSKRSASLERISIFRMS